MVFQFQRTAAPPPGHPAMILVIGVDVQTGGAPTGIIRVQLFVQVGAYPEGVEGDQPPPHEQV